MLSTESGSTLVGELVALGILGMALAVLLSAICTSMMGTAIVEQRVVAENLARTQLEAIKAAGYQEDPAAIPYPTIPVADTYSLTVAVTHWISPTGPFTDAQPSDCGMQRITVTVNHNGEPVSRLEGFKVDR